MGGVQHALPGVPSVDEPSADETLANAIVAHFVHGAAFPENTAELFALGKQHPPLSPYGDVWTFAPGEVWHGHAVCAYFVGLEDRKDFRLAGAAELLLGSQALHIKLGVDGPARGGGYAPVGAPRHNSRLETRRVLYRDILEVGTGDLLRLKTRNGEALVFRLAWPRSVAAMLAGLRGKNNKALGAPKKTLGVGKHNNLEND